jgi:clan AA aspartic protease (TIGR02281 family)
MAMPKLSIPLLVGAILFVICDASIANAQKQRASSIDKYAAYSVSGVPFSPRQNPRIKAYVNGHPFNFLVDTGATHVLLSYEVARSAGIDVEHLVFDSHVHTYDKRVHLAAIYRIEIMQIASGPVRRNVDATILSKAGGRTDNLLGMTFLATFKSVVIDNEHSLVWFRE